MHLLSWPNGIIAHQPTIPLFAEHQAHPFVPLNNLPATARSCGQGRSQTGACTLPLTAASPVAGSFKFVRLLHLLFHLAFACALLGVLASLTNSITPSLADVRPVRAHHYTRYIAEAAHRFAIPAQWIRGVMEVESAGNERAVSRTGAMGLMQIMPATWQELRARYHLGNDPFEPHDNILASAAYLRELYDRYGWPGALAAYNAGPERYEEHLAGRPLPRETRDYVAKLAPISTQNSSGNFTRVAAFDQLSLSSSTLFVARTYVFRPTSEHHDFNVAHDSKSGLLDATRRANTLFVALLKPALPK
jgi:Transglycosylase SLT domain